MDQLGRKRLALRESSCGLDMRIQIACADRSSRPVPRRSGRRNCRGYPASALRMAAAKTISAGAQELMPPEPKTGDLCCGRRQCCLAGQAKILCAAQVLEILLGSSGIAAP
jgi:hypothetical protein